MADASATGLSSFRPFRGGTADEDLLILLRHTDKPVMRRIGAPHLSGPAKQLADPHVALLSGDAAELACRRIETQQRTGTEIAHPHDVVLVDINRVRLRPIAGQTPRSPRVLACVETSDLPGEELADPQAGL